jgi:hypothetical protein
MFLNSVCLHILLYRPPLKGGDYVFPSSPAGEGQGEGICETAEGLAE